MKHNNMRDDAAQHAYEKKLSRNPVTIDSVPDSDDYKARYELAMELISEIITALQLPNVAIDRVYYSMRSRYEKLRDSSE